MSKSPLTVLVSGINERALLYASYHIADLIKSNESLLNLNLFYKPKVKDRYVLFGPTTHGRRYYRPGLYSQTLKELPRYGYNGVILYPESGTPFARSSSPIIEDANGILYEEAENTQNWKEWIKEIKTYGHRIVLTLPPIIPPGYDIKKVKDFYAVGPEPMNFLSNLKVQFKTLLTLLTSFYPEIDHYFFNSAEGATFGTSVRFFGHPDHSRFDNESYLNNNEMIMQSYFDVLIDFFGKDLSKISFWTHNYGTTNEGLRRMREVVFQYPEVMIVEDDYWNNNLWPFDLPSLNYLTQDLRDQVVTKNPFGMYQITTDGEYYGGGSLPNAYPGSHIRSAKEAVNYKADLVIQRVDLHDRTAFGTLFGTMEILPLAASKQLWYPTPAEDEIWTNWANRRFGKQAAPHVIKALQRSHQIIINGLSCNGVDLLAQGSEFMSGTWSQYKNPLSRFSLFSKPGIRIVNKDQGKDIIYSPEYTLYQMDTHTISIKDYQERQDVALQEILLGKQDIENAKAYLTPSDYQMLTNVFDNGQQMINTLKILGNFIISSKFKYL